MWSSCVSLLLLLLLLTHRVTRICYLPLQHKVIKACSKEELASLSLQPPAIPSLCLTSISSHQPLPIRLQAVQACISSFQYNHSSGYNYNVAKKRPLQAILATAAGILANPLPIKCIGA